MLEKDLLLKLAGCVERKGEAFEMPATLPVARVTEQLCLDVYSPSFVFLGHFKIEDMLLNEDFCGALRAIPFFFRDFLALHSNDEFAIHLEIGSIHMADEE